MIGIVTGYKIDINRDGDKQRLLLQVEMITGDVRTVEFIPQSGEDTNPAKGSRIFVMNEDEFDSDSYQIGIASSDDLLPGNDPGEKSIYSTDSPATERKAEIKLDTNGNIIIDAYGGTLVEIKTDGTIVINSGTDNAIRYTGYDVDIQSIVTQVNANLTLIATAIGNLGGSYIPVPLVVNTIGSKVAEVIIP